MNGSAMRRWRRSLDRWGAALRYHRPEQLLRRAWTRVRDRLPIGEVTVDGPTPRVREKASGGRESPGADEPQRPHRGIDIPRAPNRQVRLLNRDFELGFPPRWDDTDALGIPLLAVFHLHYHEWLLPIAEHEPDAAWTVLQSWIDRFPHRERTSAGWSAWHPYCISRRVFTWLKLLALKPSVDLRTAMTDHLAKQARWLTSRFERDIGGNHLWENARALAALGAFFEGAEADDWRRRGLTTLWQCLRDQLSPEGEHFERSPMYQAELAHGLEELAGVLNPIEPDAAERCRATAVRMISFLQGLRHPDGGLPILGDTTLDGGAASPSSLVREGGDRSEPGEEANTQKAPLTSNPSPTRGEENYWHGEYFVHRSTNGFLLFDAGNIGPDHLPAHGHADLLGFEASAFGRRLFVDSGVYCYQGPRREEFRKSAAHNVLAVDGIELADVWGSFRIGRRGHVVSRQSGRNGDLLWIKAEHDAYRRMGVRVQRWWILADGGVWISVHAVLGRGNRALAEYLHLHPEILWTRNARSVTLQVGEGVVRWSPSPEVDVRTETTAYSERFYEERPKTTLILERQTELPAVSAWGVALGGGDFDVRAVVEGNRLAVRWTHDGVERRFERELEGERGT
jgi:uncharacterized heparinase superfamily protein